MLFSMAETRLAVAVVNYRTPKLTLECLGLVLAAAPHADVRLVDTDPTATFEREITAAYPAVTYVPCANHSYAHAVNTGLADADTDYLALMNADVMVSARTFTDLTGALASDPGAGAAGPLPKDESGRPQSLGVWYGRHYRALARRAQATRGSRGPASVVVPWLSGCLHLIRRADWLALGGYDETFRFWNEDLDFGLRLAATGRHSLLVDSPVVHLGGSSTPAHPAFGVEGRRGGLIVGRRHYPAALYALQRGLVGLEAAGRSVLGRSPGERAAQAELLRMARTGDLSTSPFGATLDDRPEW